MKGEKERKEMKIQTEALKAAYRIVSAVGTIGSVSASQFIRVRFGGGIHMNLSGIATAEAAVPGDAVTGAVEEGEYFLDRRMLGGFLAAHSSEEEIDWSMNESVVTLRSGRHKLDLTSAEVSGYQSWQMPATKGKKKQQATIEMSEEEQQQASLLRRYVSESETCRHLQAIRLLSGYGALSTDMFSMAAVLDSGARLEGFLPPLAPDMLSGSSLWIGEQGTAAIFPQGYYFHPISEECHRAFPLDALKNMIALVDKESPAVVFPRTVLQTLVEQMSGFIFGKDGEAAAIECSGKPKKGVVLQLKVSGGVTEQTSDVDVVREFTAKWPVHQVVTWMDGAPSGIEEVLCYQMEFGAVLEGACNNRRYLLFVAEIV